MSRGFRVWDIESECYLPVSKGGNDGVLGVTINGNGIIYLEDGEANIQNNGVIIERDTGLKDKNGKRICEGDIIQCHLSPISSTIFTGVVEFRPGCIMFKNFADGGAYAFNFLGAIEAVIGNIHENPELIGVENE